jgi:hypothetical protein
MSTRPAKAGEGGDPDNGKPHHRFRRVYVCFHCVGYNQTWHEFGHVQLDSDSFEEEWKALVFRAKRRIDWLNVNFSGENADGTMDYAKIISGIDTVMCSESDCIEEAVDGDYLCAEHRELVKA